MQYERIRVDLDTETLRLLREQALEQRRPTSEEAAVILRRSMARRARRRAGTCAEGVQP